MNYFRKYILVIGALFFFTALYAQPEITVNVIKGGYSIKAVFSVKAPLNVAWETLTDYENIPYFVPSISSSKIVEKKDKIIILKQNGIFKFLHIIPIKLRLLMEVKEEKYEKIFFQDMLHKDFDFYEGRWEFSETAGATVITYSLKANPNFPVPGFITRKIFLNEATALVNGITSEIDKRHKIQLEDLQDKNIKPQFRSSIK